MAKEKKGGKRIRKLREKVVAGKLYPLDEACEVVADLRGRTGFQPVSIRWAIFVFR